MQHRTLLVAIRALFAQYHGRYGSPCIHRALRDQGVCVSRRRAARLMREDGLRAKAVLGYRANAGVHRFFAAQPILVRRTTATTIDRIWVADSRYLTVGNTWPYLAVVTDQCSRRILAWTLQPRRDARVTRYVVAAALWGRRPSAGLIFHCERGGRNSPGPCLRSSPRTECGRA